MPVCGPFSSRLTKPRRRCGARRGVRIAARHCTARPTRASRTVWRLSSEAMPGGSLCCCRCRRRVTPPSARFFGRRFRVAPLLVMVSALVAGDGARVEAVRRKWGIPVLTLRRWRQWWRETFAQTRAWRAEAGRAGGGARGGATAVFAAPHPRPRPALAAVAQPDVASAVDGL